MHLIGHQGDVCFYSVKKLPKELVQDQQTKLGIFAYGEFSGHAHQLVELDAAEVFKDPESNLIYLKVNRRVGIAHGRARDFVGKEADHDYHHVVSLDPGLYSTGIVEETDWLTKTIRRVVD
jgi:CBS-domain-containing membrane protein